MNDVVADDRLIGGCSGGNRPENAGLSVGIDHIPIDDGFVALLIAINAKVVRVNRVPSYRNLVTVNFDTVSIIVVDRTRSDRRMIHSQKDTSRLSIHIVPLKIRGIIRLLKIDSRIAVLENGAIRQSKARACRTRWCINALVSSRDIEVVDRDIGPSRQSDGILIVIG